MPPELTRDDREALLALARMAVGRAIGTVAHWEAAHHPVFDRRAGAFVTLHVAGALRGCIGTPEDASPLGRVVAQCAAAAAREDPRFAPITAADLEALSIEISVLSSLVRCRGPEEIVVGRHGLVVERRGRRGLLLPQVASVRQWTPLLFLEQTCLKAGLGPDAWRDGAVIHVFEADVFGDAGEQEPPDPASL